MNTSKFMDKHGICLISISPNGKYVAMANRRNALLVMRRKDNEVQRFRLKSRVKVELIVLCILYST